MSGPKENLQEEPKGKRHSPATGWPPGSIGDMSVRLGYDVRDLKMAGYSDDEIDQVLSGQRTLDDLLSSPPLRKS